MAATDYRIISRWHVAGAVDEIAAVLAEAESWARWWPAAFLDVRELGCGGPARGRTARVHSKGWLPYTLRLDATVVRCSYPHRCTFEVSGDVVGSCDCSLRQDGPLAALRFDWRVSVRKPLVRALSWALKPVFVANHRWVMRQGRRSLRIELDRRAAERSGRPFDVAPPGPTFPHGRSLPRWAKAWRAAAFGLGGRMPTRPDRGPR